MQKNQVDKPFPCSGCGVCCLHIKDNIENAIALLLTGDPRKELLEEMAAFPYKYDEAGRCEMLGDDHRCKVYENRPDVCQVSKVWERFYSESLSRPEYYRFTAALCNSLITEAKADDKFLIDPSII
jgi:Fe-S-cluster containining protein